MAPRPPPPLPRSKERDVEQIRRAVEGSERNVPAHLDGNGKRIDATIEATSTKEIRHGFGRKLRGWYLVDGPKSKSAALDGSIDEVNRSNDTLTLRNGSSQPVTLTVWVY